MKNCLIANRSKTNFPTWEKWFSTGHKKSPKKS
nr:MAG TPA: hypothetical protein [Bacteriophage sp.]